MLVVLAEDETIASRSFANLANVRTTSFAQLSAHDVLRNEWLVFSDRTLPGSAAFAGTVAGSTEPGVETTEPETTTEEAATHA